MFISDSAVVGWKGLVTVSKAEWSSDVGDRKGEKPNDDVFMSEYAEQVWSDVVDTDSEKSLDVATKVLLFKSGGPIMVLSDEEQIWNSTSSFKNTDWQLTLDTILRIAVC